MYTKAPLMVNEDNLDVEIKLQAVIVQAEAEVTTEVVSLTGAVWAAHATFLVMPAV